MSVCCAGMDKESVQQIISCTAAGMHMVALQATIGLHVENLDDPDPEAVAVLQQFRELVRGGGFWASSFIPNVCYRQHPSPLLPVRHE